MKQLYFFLSFFLFSQFLFGQNYLNESSKWYSIRGDVFDHWWRMSNYEIIGDTIIEGKTYYKVFNDYLYLNCGFGCENPTVTAGNIIEFLREENKKFYRYAFGQDRFIVDFDLNLGDTIHHFNDFETIIEVDSFEFDGGYRKLFRTSWYSEIYEGIGTEYGLFEGFDWLGDEGVGVLLCYGQNEATVSLNEFYDPYFEGLLQYVETCDSAFFTNIGEKTINKVELNTFPNPVNYHLNIALENANKINEIKIIGIDGKKYNFEILNKNNYEIKLKIDENTPKGIFVLMIKIEDYFISKKIIMN